MHQRDLVLRQRIAFLRQRLEQFGGQTYCFFAKALVASSQVAFADGILAVSPSNTIAMANPENLNIPTSYPQKLILFGFLMVPT